MNRRSVYELCDRLGGIAHDFRTRQCGPDPGRPGHPMGDLMRQYWIPACLSSELEPSAPPMRLLLLGEKLIAFRDNSGPGRHHGSPLPASRRVAVLRPQRRVTACAASITAGSSTPRATASTCPTSRPTSSSSTKVKPRPTSWSSAAASSGPTWARAPTPPPLPDARSQLLPDGAGSSRVHPARVQLAAGARGRHRHLALRLPASRHPAGQTTCRTDSLHRYNLTDRAPRYHVRTPTGARCTRPTVRPMTGRSTAASRTSSSRSHACRPTAPSPITSWPAFGCRWMTPTRWSSRSSGPSARGAAPAQGRQPDPRRGIADGAPAQRQRLARPLAARGQPDNDYQIDRAIAGGGTYTASRGIVPRTRR